VRFFHQPVQGLFIRAVSDKAVKFRENAGLPGTSSKPHGGLGFEPVHNRCMNCVVVSILKNRFAGTFPANG
jgi:hypothetical protein